VTVMDDFSRFILAWQLKNDMTADSLIDVTQEAVDRTDMTEHHQREGPHNYQSLGGI